MNIELKQYGYIYITECLVNGKKYIGQHKSDSFDEKYIGSGKNFLSAVNKYGKDNFRVKILEPDDIMPTVCYSRKQLDEAELYYIQKYDCVNSEDYYNLSIGGTGGWEQYDSSGEKNGMYGVHRFGEENPMYGKHQSEEARKKMSEAIKNRGGHFGENNPMYGRKQSDEQKLKTKIAKSDEFGNYIYVGEKAVNFGKHETHPCFGLHWYNNGIVSVKAKECPEGFVEGRLMKNSTCPYCDFQSNCGNVAKHIIKYHQGADK